MRKESDLLKSCLDYCQMLQNRGDIAWFDRLNSGEAFVGEGKRKRRIKLCKAGSPDMYIILADGTVLWIETKLKGKYLSKDQKEFADIERLINHRYLVIREVMELVEYIGMIKL